MRHLFKLRNYIGTAFVFLFLILLQTVGVQVEVLNVFEQVFENFELSDVFYTTRDPKSEPYEQNVVLVNIGDLDRKGIAKEIAILSKYKPKVIGMDVNFPTPKQDDLLGDMLLMQAMKQAGNVIVGSQPKGKQEDGKFKEVVMPFDLIRPHVSTGHVYTGQDYQDFITWRDIPPFVVTKKDKKEDCLTLAMMKVYDKEKAEIFEERGNEREEIYFKGNLDKYTKLDVKQVLNEEFDPKLIEGKMVLMGYMGSGYTDYYFAEDKFYTPLNENIMGRSVPDMYGVVVHANVLSMMLEETYVNKMPLFLALLIAGVICFFNVSLFAWILDRKEWAVWYNMLTKSIQFVEAVVVLVISFYAFAKFHYSVNFSVTFFVILLSGDLTEIFIDVGVRLFNRFYNKKPQRKEPLEVVSDEVSPQESDN